MVKNRLSSYLSADLYKLSLDLSQSPVLGMLLISGRRIHKPSQRLMLHQKNLKIRNAKIQTQRKNITIEHSVERINRLPSFQQVRIHTKEFMYPGRFQVELSFLSPIPPSEYMKLANLDKEQLKKAPLCSYFPLIDEPESREKAEFEISYTK